mgnify:CR=1 FL=1
MKKEQLKKLFSEHSARSKYFKDVIKPELRKFYQDFEQYEDYSDKALIYLFRNNIFEPPRCAYCNKILKFQKSGGFAKCCSNSCNKKLWHVEQKELEPEYTYLSLTELRETLTYLYEKYPHNLVQTNEYKSIKGNILEYTNFLDSSYSLVARNWCIINNITSLPVCVSCGKPTNFYNLKGFVNHCSLDCANSNPDTIDKTNITNLERYGVKRPCENKDINEKRINTLGVKAPILLKSKAEIKQLMNKRKENCLEKYGLISPNSLPHIIEKSRKTNIERYGVDTTLNFYWLYDEWNIKKRATSLKNYGSLHPMQNEDYFNYHQKRLFRRKKYIFPSGRVEYVQGYEPQILDELINHFEEEDIVCGKGLPEIWYEFNDKRRRYFPDIYIKSRNMIIEVKSIYTYNKGIEQNHYKMTACLDAGYNFWFAIGK